MDEEVSFTSPPELNQLCDANGITPEELVRQFIADLCDIYSSDEDGFNTSGSDERDLAKQYFERVGYSWQPYDPHMDDIDEDYDDEDDLDDFDDEDTEDYIDEDYDE